MLLDAMKGVRSLHHVPLGYFASLGNYEVFISAQLKTVDVLSKATDGIHITGAGIVSGKTLSKPNTNPTFGFGANCYRKCTSDRKTISGGAR